MSKSSFDTPIVIDGKTLIAWGIKPGKTFKSALADAQRMLRDGEDIAAIEHAIRARFPTPVFIERRAKGHYGVAIKATSDEDAANIAAVRMHMDDLMRCPMLEHGAIMPDACPSGSAKGTIPVGGAVISRAIHPAFHSADICCSMYATLMPPGTATRTFMDALQASTRFGPGGRKADVAVGRWHVPVAGAGVRLEEIAQLEVRLDVLPPLGWADVGTAVDIPVVRRVGARRG